MTRRLLGPLALLALLASLALAPSAGATFAGANGRIAMTYSPNSNDDPDDGLRVIQPTPIPGVTSPPWSASACIGFNAQGCPAGLGTSFSPTGAVVAFGAVNGATANQIGIAAADGTTMTLLPAQTANDAQPSFAPAQSQLVFQGGTYNGPTNLYTLTVNLGYTPLTVSGLTQLTTTGASNPDWGSNNRIAYTANGNLSAIAPNGTKVQQLTRGGGDQASWSPGATAIVFTRARQVWRMTVGASGLGRAAVQLTHAGGSWPTWSPDGTLIAFERGGSIWTMKANGSGARKVYADPGVQLGAGGLAWQPLR